MSVWHSCVHDAQMFFWPITFHWLLRRVRNMILLHRQNDHKLHVRIWKETSFDLKETTQYQWSYSYNELVRNMNNRPPGYILSLLRPFGFLKYLYCTSWFNEWALTKREPKHLCRCSWPNCVINSLRSTLWNGLQYYVTIRMYVLQNIRHWTSQEIINPKYN
jgi:hypothetical protein